MRITFIIILAVFSSITCIAQNKNPLRDSLNNAERALSLRPDSIDLRLKKARWNMELGQWDYAKSEYDIVLRRQPDNIAALFFRSYANEKLGRIGFARQDLESVLTIVPNNFEAKLGLALLDDKDKKKTKALDEMNLLVESFPDSAIAYAARGSMERARQMYYLAEYDYSEAIRRDPTNTDYILNRADVLISMGKLEEARRDIKMLIKLGVPRSALEEYIRKTSK